MSAIQAIVLLNSLSIIALVLGVIFNTRTIRRRAQPPYPPAYVCRCGAMIWGSDSFSIERAKREHAAECRARA